MQLLSRNDYCAFAATGRCNRGRSICGALVEEMQGLLAPHPGRECAGSIVEADRALWPTLVDPNQMELVILNLAINARDAMLDGGTLSISITNSESGGDAPPELTPGQYVVLKVSDTGTGMDAATLARATEPRPTTKETGKGTGLGLAMMQGVVAQSGGATRLRSTPGVWHRRRGRCGAAFLDCHP